MLNNVFKYKKLGFAMRAMIVSAAIVFSACVFSSYAQDAASGSSQKTVTLYGQKITIDPTKVDIPGEPYQWRDTAYLIPEILPGILENKDKRSLQQLLATLGQWTNKYQYNLYQCSLYNLAQSLEDQGMVDAAYVVKDEKGFSIQPVPERVSTGTRQERVDLLFGALGYWIARNEWAEYVKFYNSAVKEKSLSVSAFDIPARMYKYSRALYNLDYVVRQSPEVEAQDLQGYGVLGVVTPECMENLESPSGQDPIFAPSEDDVKFPIPDVE